MNEKRKKSIQKSWVLIVILLFLVLALAPSISATEKKRNNWETSDEISEKIKDFHIKNVNELKNVLLNGRIRHPLLYLSVYLVSFRVIRGVLLLTFSSNHFEWFEPFEIYHPLLYYRSIWLIFSAVLWQYTWVIISQELGWNWNLDL